MMGDPSGSVAGARHGAQSPWAMKVLGYERCKRFALYIVDGVVKIERIAEAEDDPRAMTAGRHARAGDDRRHQGPRQGGSRLVSRRERALLAGGMHPRWCNPHVREACVREASARTGRTLPRHMTLAG